MTHILQGYGGKIGSSLCEDEYIQLALDLEKKAAEKGVKTYMANDIIAADKFAADANTQICESSNIPDGWLGLDAGPESIKEMKEIIENSATILWNGPVGVFEMDKLLKVQGSW